MGSKSGGGGETEIRYAPYLEDAHIDILWDSAYERERMLLRTGGNVAEGTGPIPTATENISPFYTYTTARADVDLLTMPDIDAAFFSTGYTIASFPSLYDMFGKFVAGLDIEALFSEIYDDMVNGPVTNEVITVESTREQDDIDLTAIPRMMAGLRDMNAVMSDSPMDNITFLQAQKVKQTAAFASTIKMRAMELAVNRWAHHLQWNPGVVDQYMKLNQLFWATTFDYKNASVELISKHELWRFTILAHQREILAALNGAAAAQVKGQDTSGRAIAGIANTAAGAIQGFQMGGPAGAVVGGLMGIASSFK